MAEQILCCEGCNVRYKAKGARPGKTYKCPRCGQVLKRLSGPSSELARSLAARLEPRRRKRDDPLVGRVVGDFLIEEKLGEGGMGSVYRAKHLALEREVALKLLSPDLAERHSHAVERFQREARAAARFTHPNVVAIFSVGAQGGHHYIEMELVEGESAYDYAHREGPCDVKEATRIVLEAAKGLAAAHAHNIVHRDIKPGNIMLRRDGAVKVMDFGLAKDVTTESQLTVGGQIIGTPYFMSPEQCEGKQLDGRSDIYSLGATYYYLLTLDYPFKGDTFLTIMFKHKHDPPPKVTDVRPDVPASVQQIIERAMAKSPDDRYPNAEAMVADLEKVLAEVSGRGAEEAKAAAPAPEAEPPPSTTESAPAAGPAAAPDQQAVEPRGGRGW